MVRRYQALSESGGNVGDRPYCPPDGPILHYPMLDPAERPGILVGRRSAREFAPATMRTRTWNDPLDSFGIFGAFVRSSWAAKPSTTCSIRAGTSVEDSSSMQPPDRDVVGSVLTDLIVGSISVEVASARAGQWVYLDLPIISDLIVWKALKRITGADSNGGTDGLCVRYGGLRTLGARVRSRDRKVLIANRRRRGARDRGGPHETFGLGRNRSTELLRRTTLSGHCNRHDREGPRKADVRASWATLHSHFEHALRITGI